MFGIEKYRAQRWHIARVSGRTSALMSVQHVLYPAAGMQHRKAEMAHKNVVHMVHRLHGIWFNKVKTLIAQQLWWPGGENTPSASMLTFRRVLHCRPSCVYFQRGNRGRLRPCRRDRFCPFCWARAAGLGYRTYKHEIRKARKTNKNLVLVCRVLEHKVLAESFQPDAGYSPEAVLKHAETLRAVLERHRAAYQALAKQLQRKTLGSAWRLAVDPCDDGWRIEARQLFLCEPKKAMPLVCLPGTKTAFRKSVRVHDDEGLLDLVGRFFEYPQGLTLSYPELVAVYLQATANIRTSSGTGVLRPAGSYLMRTIKKDKQDGACSYETKFLPGQELDHLSADVPM